MFIVLHIYMYIGLVSKYTEIMIHEDFSNDDQSSDPNLCHKNLGDSKRLRHWNRGHLFIVRPCGHIDFSQPIYK